MIVELKGYGANASFDGDALRLTARTSLAFGAKERIVPVRSISAVSFKPANALQNGNITVQVEGAKYQVFFVRKMQPAAEALYAALLSASGANPNASPAGTVRFDRLNALAERAAATAATPTVEAHTVAVAALPSVPETWAQTPAPTAFVELSQPSPT